MQRTDCYQTLQGSAKKLVSATGLQEQQQQQQQQQQVVNNKTWGNGLLLATEVAYSDLD